MFTYPAGNCRIHACMVSDSSELLSASRKQRFNNWLNSSAMNFLRTRLTDFKLFKNQKLSAAGQRSERQNSRFKVKIVKGRRLIPIGKLIWSKNNRINKDYCGVWYIAGECKRAG